MAYGARKTEHGRPKKGRGGFYGPKAFAKKGSNRRRPRQADKRTTAIESGDKGPSRKWDLTPGERVCVYL